MALKSRSSVRPRPVAEDPALAPLAAAFDADWAEKRAVVENSPVTAFLQVHEIAGTPNEHTVCGAGGVIVKLGDLRAYVRATA